MMTASGFLITTLGIPTPDGHVCAEPKLFSTLTWF